MKSRFATLAALLLIAQSAWAIPVGTVLDVHYDGSNVSTLGADVTSWNNQGLLGAGANATPINTNEPTRVIGALNGQNVIDFAGVVPTVLQTPTFASMPQANHVFFVLSSDVNTPGSGQVVFDGVTGPNRHFYQILTGGTGHIFAGASHGGGSALSTGVYRMFSLIYNGASSQVDVNALPYFTPGDIGAHSLNQIGLGNSPPNGNPANLQFDGQYAEVALFSTNLNSAQQKLVENYLSAKFNIGNTVAGVNNTLGATHDHYAGDLDTNADYDFGVTGIGRVNVSNQHLSDLDDGLSISAVSLDDGEWLLGGHDGTLNALVNFEADPNEVVGQRWDRVFYLDKTGALDATLGFDFEDTGLVAPGGSNTFHLLYSADSDFSDGWTILDETALISGGTVSFTVLDSNLLDGYFTLGLNIQQVPEPSTCLLLSLGSLGLVWQGRRQRRKADRENVPRPLTSDF